MTLDKNISRDVKLLRKKVRKLEKVPAKKLSEAVCDIIDIGGYSLAVLLDKMICLSAKRQKKVAAKIEEFLFFHPDNGRKILPRLIRTLAKVHQSCVPNVLSAIVDVASRLEDGKNQISRLGDFANKVLLSDADLPRKAKAVEVLSEAGLRVSIPVIIQEMKKSVDEIDKFANYQFVEVALLALKRLGGDSLLRLLINPTSGEAIKQMRVEWRSKSAPDLNSALVEINQLDDGFAQLMLKVIEISEFSLPFMVMIKEGLDHSDKWVRQTAAASMQNLGKSADPEVITRMLNDPASEVRLMAVTSLGGFDKEKTGEALEKLAGKAGEAVDIRVNALYALYSQKNLSALQSLIKSDNQQVSANAIGLSALLLPREEGLESLYKCFLTFNEENSGELIHYLLEILEPEDLQELLGKQQKVAKESHKERLLGLLKKFLTHKAGPRLSEAIAKLPDAEKKAICLLIEVGDKLQVH
jgi:HEAT repeat protein